MVNFNGATSLNSQFIKCVQSLLETNFQHFELIVVDNGSTDESASILKANFSREQRLKIIESRINLGYPGGCNLGFANASGEARYVVFLNNDLIVEPDWLKELVSVMESDATIGMAGSRTVVGKGNSMKIIDGAFLDNLGMIHMNWAQSNNNNVKEVFAATGACLIARTDIFKQIGGFDDTLFIQNEEVDLCWRMWVYGKRVVTVPRSVVYHIGGVSVRKLSSELREYYGARNRLLCFLKNYGCTNLLFYGTALVLIYIFYAYYVSLKGKPIYARSYIRALLWNVKNLRGLWAKRVVVQNLRRLNDSDLKKIGIFVSPSVTKLHMPKYGIS